MLLPLLFELLCTFLLIVVHPLSSVGFLLLFQQVIIDLDDNHRRKAAPTSNQFHDPPKIHADLAI